MYSVSESNEFEPRPKSAKNQFQLSSGLNLEKCNIILSGINHFELRLKFKPWLKFFKFGLLFYNYLRVSFKILQQNKMSFKVFISQLVLIFYV